MWREPGGWGRPFQYFFQEFIQIVKMLPERADSLLFAPLIYLGTPAIFIISTSAIIMSTFFYYKILIIKYYMGVI
jgi:hypothetical protein